MNNNGCFISKNYNSVDDLCHQSVKEKWNSLRMDLCDNKYRFDDIESAKSSKFLSEFNDLFINDNARIFYETTLANLSKQSYSLRGAIIKKGEPSPAYDRFIPNKQFIREDNRFSPKGVEWLYLALGTPKNPRNYEIAIRCAQKECRVNSGDIFAYCEFIIVQKSSKIIDLTIGDNWTRLTQKAQFQNILNSLADLNRSLDKKRYDSLILLSTTQYYSSILSKELFLPISIKGRDSYAPFHCLAKYFQSLGYEGILYQSTVYTPGKNLVLFNKDLAHPYGTINSMTIE